MQNQDEPQQTKQEKQATDLICFYIFLIFQTISLLIALYAICCGNPAQLALPYDPDHNICGIDYPDYPFIYFVTPQTNFLFRTVCLKQCPTEKSESLDCQINSVVTKCTVDPSVNDLSQSVLVYNTMPYKGHLCLPTTEYYYTVLQNHLFPGNYQVIARNLYDSQYIILLSFVLSLILSIIILIFVEKYASQMIWSLIILIAISLFVGGIVSILMYIQATHIPTLSNNDVSQIDNKTLQKSADSQFQNQRFYLITSIILFTLSIMSITIGFISKKKVKQTIKFIKVGGDFIKQNQTIIIIPIGSAVVATIYFIFWIKTSLYLYSATTYSNKPHSLPFDQAETTLGVIIMTFYHYFILFWNISFIIGCCEYALCGAVCEWYYRQGNYKQSDNINPIKLSTNALIYKSLGSVALGSILISLFALPKFIIDCIYSCTNGNSCATFYENILLSFTKYGYILGYLRNNHYIQSSILAKSIILRDLEMFLLLGGLGESFITIGRLFVSSFCALVCYLFLWQLEYGSAVAFLCFCLCFCVSSAFMAMYGISSEAIYMLYLYNKIMDPEDKPQCTVTLQQIIDIIAQEQLVVNV